MSAVAIGLVLVAILVAGLVIISEPPASNLDEIKHLEEQTLALELRIVRLERANWTSVESGKRLESIEQRLSELELSTLEKGSL